MEVIASLITAVLLYPLIQSSGIVLTKPMKNSSRGSAEKQQTSQPCVTGSSGRSLKCNVPVLNNNISFGNNTARIASLKIYCDTGMPSRLYDGFFKPVRHFLVSISIYNCNIVNISRNAFRGMNELRTLSIKGRSNSILDKCEIQFPDLFNVRQLTQSEVTLHLTTTVCDSLLLPEGLLSQLEKLVRLEFRAMRLNSSVWHELENLKNLRSLYLTSNNITIIDSSSLSKLKNLYELYLDENYIHTVLNGTFKSLSLLRQLTLSRNRIRFIEKYAFRGLTGLLILDLQTNDICKVEMETFQRLSKLRTLYLSNNNISTIEMNTFKSLRKLDTLDLSKNYIRTVEKGTFKGLLKLHKLDLSENQIKILPKQLLSQLLSLWRLDMSCNCIETLPTFPSSLTSLDVSNNNIVDFLNSSFEGLSHLSNVNLSCNGLVQLPEDAFRTNHKLYSLDLSFNQIVKLPTLPRLLNTLDLKNNNIADLCNSSLLGLSHLSKISLSSNGLVQLSEDAFKTNTKLHSLDLSFNQIVRLPKLPRSLKTLNLKYNNVDLSKNTLEGITDLSNVNLGSNNLVQLPIGVFWTNYNVQFLGMSFNQFVQLPALPRSLKTLDLRNNNIANLSNRSFSWTSDLSELDLSENKISKCTLYDIPDNMWNLNLSSNNLSVFSFHLTPELRYVDLRNNKLASLAISDLKKYQLTRRVSGVIYLAGNGGPFQCVCNLEVQNRGKPFIYDSRKDIQYRIRIITSLNCTPVKKFWIGGITKIRTKTFICNTACYNSCTCYRWRYINDINIVNCLNAGLTSIPDNISKACTILDLSGNKLPLLKPGHFDGLLQLQELYLNSSYVAVIKKHTFRELSNLIVLDISHNSILRLDSEIFKGLKMLNFLNLSSNRIIVIVDNTFKSLEKLQYLDLSRNNMETIPSSDIKSMSKLVSLKLSNNQWSCECSFLELLVPTITKSNVLLVDRNDIICLTTNRNKIHIAKIYMPEFCPDKHANSDTKNIIGISVGTAVGVLVITIVSIILWYKNRKFLKVCCFVNFGWLFGSVANDEQDKLYDAFVSYSSKDDAFVLRELMPRLEEPQQGRLGYKLCVDVRDFPVGASIAETILDAVNNSRRIIMILSDNFLTSKWCHFEFQAAHEQLLKEKKNRIIMVLLHDVNNNLLDGHLKVFLRTRTYVKYGDPLFWNKIENAMPKREPAIENNANGDNIDEQLH